MSLHNNNNNKTQNKQQNRNVKWWERERENNANYYIWNGDVESLFVIIEMILIKTPNVQWQNRILNYFLSSRSQ